MTIPHNNGRLATNDRWLDIGLLGLILLISLSLRFLYAANIPFPPPDDPAYYVTVARNLYAGRGFTSDVLWQYQMAFASPTHPAGELWMPLTSWLMALSFLLFGPSWTAAQLPGLLCGAGLPALTYAVGRGVFGGQPGGRGLALAAALLVVVNGVLAYQSASADSSAPFALVTAMALWLMGRRLAIGDCSLYTSGITPAGLPNPAERECGGFGNPPRANHSLPRANHGAALPQPNVGGIGNSSYNCADDANHGEQYHKPPRADCHLRSLAIGACIGLSYLTRSEGLWLYLAFVLLMAYRGLQKSSFARDRVTAQTAPPELTIRREHLHSCLLVTFSALIVVAPWLLRNFLALGTPFPAPALRLALLTQYADLFNYVTPVTWERWWAQGAAALLSLRVTALWHNWHTVLDFLFFPTALLPVAGLWLLRRRDDLAPAIWFGALLFLVTALIFPIPTLAGTFYHSAGSLSPFMAVGAVYAGKKGLAMLARRRNWRRDFFLLVYAALLVVALTQWGLTYRITGEEGRRQGRQMAAAAAWLADHPGPAVISTLPFNLNYLTGRPALMLPVGEEPAAVRDLAHRYGARYLVITQEFGLYPQRLRAATAEQGFRLVHRTEEIEVYWIE